MYMKIDKGNNTYFGSRNLVIRQADDMARRINQTFPMLSSTKYLNHDNYYNHFPCRSRRNNITRQKILNMRHIAGNGESLFEKYSNMIDAIKSFKVGNCGECSFLAKVFAECNELKNAYRADLYCGNDEIDHVVLYVNDKKPYIIDPWLGFADYVPKAFERYVGEYFRFMFDDDFDGGQHLLRFKKHDASVLDFSHRKFSKSLIKELTNRYPELLLKGGK